MRLCPSSHHPLFHILYRLCYRKKVLCSRHTCGSHIEAFSTGRYIIQPQNTNINEGLSQPSVVLAAFEISTQQFPSALWAQHGQLWTPRTCSCSVYTSYWGWCTPHMHRFLLWLAVAEWAQEIGGVLRVHPLMIYITRTLANPYPLTEVKFGLRSILAPFSSLFCFLQPVT